MYTSVIIIFALIGVLSLLGVHIAYAFALASVIGLAMSLGGLEPALELMQQTALNGLKSYTLSVLPLFAVMGVVVGASGAAADLFSVVNRALRWVPGRLAVATVGGNAIFAAVTGVGAASVVAFSKIAYPVMKRAGYSDGYATGVIAGSAVLGLLIPPSIFMIVFAVLTEQSVGKLFAGGVLPGLLMAALFAFYCAFAAITLGAAGPKEIAAGDELPDRPNSGLGAFMIVVLITITLGGIWGGFFTPTEGAAVGLFGSFIIAFLKRLPLAKLWEAICEAGTTITPILLIVLGAALYSRLLALEGIPQLIGFLFEDMQLTPAGLMLVFVLIWLIMGCLIDSISIMLLTVPVFWPIAQAAGIDPIVFALIGILAIEAGVLTPPFGIAVFIVKSAVPNQDIPISQIFKGVIPYWIIILLVALIIWTLPDLATWLPERI